MSTSAAQVRRIVALGGDDWDEPGPSLLDRHILELSGRERPRVLFVPTASGDADTYVAMFYRAFPVTVCEPSHLALFNRDVLDLDAVVGASDIVYVGGGNTVNMLAVWRAHGVDTALRKAWEAGVLLCGVSAGMICWFEAGVTDSFGRQLEALDDGLGFLPGSACPHYHGEARRQPRYHEFVGGGFAEGVAADDETGLVYEGTRLVEAVVTRAGAGAWRLRRTDAGVVEDPLDVRVMS